MDVLSATCKPIMMLITAISVGGRYKLNLKGCISIRFQPIGGYPHHIEYNNSNNKLHACTLITKKCFDFHLHFVLGEGCLYYLLNVLIRLFKPEKQCETFSEPSIAPIPRGFEPLRPKFIMFRPSWVDRLYIN